MSTEPVSILAGGSLDGLPNPQPADMLDAVVGPITTNATTQVIAPQGAGVGIYITKIQVQNESAIWSTRVELKSGSTVIWRGYAASGGGGFEVEFPEKAPLQGQANDALNVVCLTTGASVVVSVSAFKAPSVGGSTPRPAHYVTTAPAGTANGSSWANAWGISAIDWTAVNPGDVVYLDGGPAGLTYSATLNLTKSGTVSSPIYVERSIEAGHDGQVILDGGRTTGQLPYYGQSTSYPYADAPRANCLALAAGVQYVVVDGKKPAGILMWRALTSGVQLLGTNNTITFRYCRIEDNGVATISLGTYRLDGWGVRLAGDNITIDRCEIRDNGQDCLQAWGGDPGVNWSNLTITNSWLYNSRLKPDGFTPFNFPTHTDGFQMFQQTHSGITVDRCVFGPNLLQGLIIGDNAVNSVDGTQAITNNVAITNSLFYGIYGPMVTRGASAVEPTNWTIDHCTFDCPETSYGNGGEFVESRLDHLSSTSANLRITRSIFTTKAAAAGVGLFYMGTGAANANNTYWRTEDACPGGTSRDPVYADSAVSGSAGVNNDYALGPASPIIGDGSPVTNGSSLLV